MDCNVIKDLIPLYVDDCCSKESYQLVKDHMHTCSACKAFYESMTDACEIIEPSLTIPNMSRINEWKASMLQSIVLFISFTVVVLGVMLEARTPLGHMNGCWAFALIIPATGFMLSLANWYFIRLYRGKRRFSNGCLMTTVVITIGGYIWGVWHYGAQILLPDGGTVTFLGTSIFLTGLFSVLSKVISGAYANMLGKE